jgi:alanyl-tRNA synthetase
MASPARSPTLRRDLATVRQEVRHLRERGAAETARQLIAAARAEGRAAIVAVLPGATADELRAIARRITTEPDLVCLLAGEAADGAHVLIARGPAATVHCGELLSRAARELDGRGGGRADHAEGRFRCSIDWASWFAV